MTKEYYAIPPSFTPVKGGTVDWSDDHYWQRIYWWQTSSFRKYFAKWYGSAYLLLGIITPITFYLTNESNLFNSVFILIIEIVIISMIFYIGCYSFDDISKFIKTRLNIGVIK